MVEEGMSGVVGTTNQIKIESQMMSAVLIAIGMVLELKTGASTKIPAILATINRRMFNCAGAIGMVYLAI
jgi:hypothetical protein